MAKNSKSRKKSSMIRRTSNHITAVIQRCIAKFHIIGDMNHLPTAFHYGDIKLHLKGMELKIGLEHANEFLLEKRQSWTFMAIHYFKTEQGIEVIPVVLVKEDTTLGEMGTHGEAMLKECRESVYTSGEGYSDDTLLFYGYYLTYGKDLNIGSVEEQLSTIFLKTTKDLTEISDNVVEITTDKVINALLSDKFHLVNSNALTTELQLEY